MENNIDINLILIIVIIFIPIIIFLFFIKKEHKIDSVVILDKIKKKSEYVSHEISYFENISDEEKLKLFGKIEIPFIKRGFIQPLIGKIKIGINLDNVEVSISNYDINIKIPEIIKISHETKNEEIGFQTRNPFFQNDINQYNLKLEQKKLEKEKEILNNNELINNAYNDIKVKIVETLYSIPKLSNKYKINYIIETPKLLIENKVNETDFMREEQGNKKNKGV